MEREYQEGGWLMVENGAQITSAVRGAPQSSGLPSPRPAPTEASATVQNCDTVLLDDAEFLSRKKKKSGGSDLNQKNEHKDSRTWLIPGLSGIPTQ